MQTIKINEIGARVGGGGTKRIWSFHDHNVVALPQKHPENWENIVNSELKHSKLCHSLGLLSQDYQQIIVKDRLGEKPALMMPSFSYLAQQGCEVRDHKTPYRNCGKTMLFGSMDNLTNADYLAKLLRALVPDIVTAIINNLNVDSDSINLAITGQSAEKLIDFSQQKLRLYFFDFPCPPRNRSLFDDAGKLDNDKLVDTAQYYLYRAYFILGSSLLEQEQKKIGVYLTQVNNFMPDYKLVSKAILKEIIEKITQEINKKQNKIAISRDQFFQPETIIPAANFFCADVPRFCTQT